MRLEPSHKDEIIRKVLCEDLLQDVDLKDDLIIDHLYKTAALPKQIYEKILAQDTRSSRIHTFINQLNNFKNISKVYDVLKTAMKKTYPWIVEKMNSQYCMLSASGNWEITNNGENPQRQTHRCSSGEYINLMVELEELELSCCSQFQYRSYDRMMCRISCCEVPKQTANKSRDCWLRKIYLTLAHYRDNGSLSNFWKACKKIEKRFPRDPSVQVMVNCQKMYTSYLYQEFDGIHTLIRDTKNLIRKSDNPSVYLAMTLNIESCIYRSEGHLKDAKYALQDAKQCLATASDDKTLGSILYHEWSMLINQTNITESTMKECNQIFYSAQKCCKKDDPDFTQLIIGLMSKFALFSFGFGTDNASILAKSGFINQHQVIQGKECLEYLKKHYFNQMTEIKRYYLSLAWSDYYRWVKNYSKAFECAQQAEKIVQKGQFKKEINFIQIRLTLLKSE